jgi:hypothetical protein
MDILNNKGVIPLVMGGLGNQMFIVSAAYITHKLNNYPLYILNNPISKNCHNKYNNDYNQSIFKYIGLHTNFDQDDAHLYFLLCNGYTYDSSIPCYEPWEPKLIKEGSMLRNYYQYYPHIKLFENEIRDLFMKGLETYHFKIKQLIPDIENYVFIHVRRGDYVEKQDIHFLQPIEYYQTCIDKLNLMYTTTSIKYILCSNDNAWVESQPFFKSLSNLKIWEYDDELETLALLSLCKKGAICANSTFSWWGAFLGAYTNRNPVFMPKKYYIDEPKYLFPDEWFVV